MNTGYRAGLMGLFLVICSPGLNAGQWGLIAGYRYIDTNYTFKHDTHPDDSFLPDSNRAGSAGTTSLDSTHWGFIGGRFETNTSSMIVNFDVGGLIGGSRDEQKNINDQRPDANGAFVYSKADWGATVALGLSYEIGAFRLGGEAQVTWINIESGWYRFGSDQRKDSEFHVMPTIGPKVGYRFNDRFVLEATVQFGDSTQAAVNAIFLLN